jgi:hypothetical protein
MEVDWKKHIDNDFSYSNKVNNKPKNFDEKMGQFTSNNLTLEPRLQEYIKKKKFYIDNKIQQEISLEREYGISNSDILIIKKFMRGDKKIYDKEVHNKIMSKETLSKKEREYFPSKSFRDDDQKNFGYRKTTKINEFDPKKTVVLKNSVIKDDDILDFRDLSTSFTTVKGKGFQLENTKMDKKVAGILDNAEDYSRFDCKEGRIRKSYGYASVEDHNYQFINKRCGTGDDSSVLRQGQSSRADNKERRTKYERNVA